MSRSRLVNNPYTFILQLLLRSQPNGIGFSISWWTLSYHEIDKKKVKCPPPHETNPRKRRFYQFIDKCFKFQLRTRQTQFKSFTAHPSSMMIQDVQETIFRFGRSSKTGYDTEKESASVSYKSILMDRKYIVANKTLQQHVPITKISCLGYIFRIAMDSTEEQ